MDLDEALRIADTDTGETRGPYYEALALVTLAGHARGQRQVIANVRALLTDGPGADTNGVPYIIQRADAEWRNAIRKALGE